MNQCPCYPDRARLVLDGTWEFRWLGDADLDAVRPETEFFDEITAVPGCFALAGERIGKTGAALCRKRFDFPGGLAHLTFGGLGLYAKIWLDGVELGEVKTPYATIGYDVRCEAGRHELTVLLDNRVGNPEKIPLFKPAIDFYGYGGIYRSVSIMQLPELFLDRVKVTTREPQNGKVKLELQLGMRSGEELDSLEFTYAFDDRPPVPAIGRVVDGKVTLETAVPGFRPWSPEHPHLHTVTVAIAGDRIIERFGIRTIATRGQEILLNGRPIRLHGVNRHESHPQFGPVQPTQLMLDDLRWAKELGANFIRGAHYQQNPEFLELCDETGMLVWEESFGWGQPEADAEDPAIVDLFAEATAAMVSESINNPSVILYGFLNESCSDTQAGRELYRRLTGVIRQLDGSRLVSYASNRFEHDLCFDLADVISVNPYPGWISQLSDSAPYLAAIRPEFDRIAAWFDSRPDYAAKPLLISEAGACGLYGVHDRARAQWSEEFQADYFSEAINAVLSNPRYAGITLWQFFDSRSFVNNGPIRCKPRGFNCAGLLDEYRRPKLAFDTVKKLFRHYAER